jgi:hypothetical protein
MATFVRASTAYKNDGSSVASGEPRFESTGLTVEEGTTNLLTANQAALTTNLNGFGKFYGTETMTRDTGVAYRVVGNGAIKLDQTSGGIGYYTAGVTVAGNNAFTFSCWLCGAVGGEVVKVGIQEKQGLTIIGTTYSSNITLTTTPTRYSITRSFAAGSDIAIGIVVFASTGTGILYGSGHQMEQKAYATSWIDGGTSRDAEVLTIPTSGVLDPSHGTIEMLVNVTPAMVESSGDHFIFGHYNGTDNNRITIGHTSNIWYVTTGNGSGTTSQSQISDTGFTTGLHRISARWSSGELCIFVDGVKGTPALSPNLPASLFTTAAIGNIGTGNNFANGQISDLMISRVARPDSQMAVRL